MTANRADEMDVWEPYHRLRIRFFGVWFGGPIALMTLVALSNAVYFVRFLLLPAFPAVVVAFCVQSYRLSRWPCPECGRHFCWRGGLFNPFAERCRHCGLRTGTDPH